MQQEYRHGGLTVEQWDEVFFAEYGHPSNWSPNLAARAQYLIKSGKVSRLSNQQLDRLEANIAAE
jgi:hypothetical protein